jgi:hypothetical protein
MNPMGGARVSLVAVPFSLALIALGAMAGCTPKIGDTCALSTDCSLQGDRACDTAQPNGYCTQFNCSANSCPDQAACVVFESSVPGCPYNDYMSPSRTARAFCMAHCQQDSDCRQSDGYVCRDPRSVPWNAIILDDNQSERICISPPDYSYPPNASLADAAVCSPTGPPVPPIDAGVNVLGADVDADAEANSDADAGADAPPDAPSDSAADAEADAVDAQAGG